MRLTGVETSGRGALWKRLLADQAVWSVRYGTRTENIRERAKKYAGGLETLEGLLELHPADRLSIRDVLRDDVGLFKHLEGDIEEEESVVRIDVGL